MPHEFLSLYQANRTLVELKNFLKCPRKDTRAENLISYGKWTDGDMFIALRLYPRDFLMSPSECLWMTKHREKKKTNNPCFSEDFIDKAKQNKI